MREVNNEKFKIWTNTQFQQLCLHQKSTMAKSGTLLDYITGVYLMYLILRKRDQ